MNKDEAYLKVAQRFIESCEQHISNGINIQEVLGFKSYHAFESIAGAYNSHYGHTIPLGHAKKLNMFVSSVRNDTQVNRKAIATIAMTLNSMRNKYLYPEIYGTGYICPKDQVSLTDVQKMVKKVNGIIKQVERII